LKNCYKIETLAFHEKWAFLRKLRGCRQTPLRVKFFGFFDKFYGQFGKNTEISAKTGLGDSPIDQYL